MSIHYSPTTVTNGLVLSLDAGNSKSYPGSGTTWTDLSGNGNHGTLINGPTFNSANGGSIVFDGVDDYNTFSATIANAIGTGNFTLNAWVKAPSVLNNYRMIFSTTQYYMYLATMDSGFTFDTISNQTFRFGATIISGTWYSCTVVRSSNIDYGYKNGVLVGSKADSTVPSGNFDVGRTTSFGGDNYYFSSSLAGLTFYNRALSAAEISQNFNALRGRYGV